MPSTTHPPINPPPSLSGLSEQEARKRIQQEGWNELPTAKGQGLWPIIINIAKEPMLLLLVFSSVIYMALGETSDALILLSSIGLIIGITLYQEQKTEHALEALRDLSSPRALVIRDGHQKRIPARELVKGDLVLIAEGDRVPADGAILENTNLSVDESLLTGESAPVQKIVWDGKTPLSHPGGHNLPFVYAGTLVTQGQGLMQVLATGPRTEMGKIGKSLQALEIERTPLKKEIDNLVRILALFGLSLCFLVVLLYGLARNNWIEGFLSGITLAMSLLPEEFPIVFTVFLALGAWRISRKQVLTRRAQAIEALGAATVLCVDKTGTLTLNQMALQCIATPTGETYDLSQHPLQVLQAEAPAVVLRTAILASRQNPFDPMEKSLRQLGDQLDWHFSEWLLIREYPLSQHLFAMTQVWHAPDRPDAFVATKGAPEAIAQLCHMDAGQTEKLMAQVQRLAQEGLRILGVAQASTTRVPHELPDQPQAFSFEFVGLLGFKDPVRPLVKDSVQTCYSAGIRVVMITGDYPVTAQTIAQEIGLKNMDKVLTGEALMQLSDADFQAQAKQVNVFARVAPDQKLRLVEALKANGDIVAMTGDGVNDGPALKSAHIGIAMGGRGTDVAREAASLVLLDDNFTSIVQAIQLGRRIFDNLRKAMAYLLSVHIPIAGMSVFPVMLNLPLILMPIHIVFLEFVIDPACSLIFEGEPEERDTMARPPRGIHEPVINRDILIRSLIQGSLALLIAIGVFITALLQYNQADARTLAFTILVAGNLALIFSNRSWTRTFLDTLRQPNKALWWILGATLLALGLVLYLPPLRTTFHFSPLHPDDLLLCLGSAVVMILLFEKVKQLKQ